MKIEVKILDLGVFLELLDYLRAYTTTCKFKVYADHVELFCKDAINFPNTCLKLNSNSITTSCENEKYLQICLKDMSAFRNALSILKDITDETNISLNINATESDDSFIAQTIEYAGKNNTFEIQCALPIVVEDYVSNGLKDTPTTDFIFKVDPKILKTMQTKAMLVVDIDNVSPYFIYSNDTNSVTLSLKNSGKKDTAKYNSISIPISTSCSGEIKNKNLETNGIAISMTSFKIFNILRIDDTNINCFFNNKWNVFGVISKKNYDNDLWIKSQLFIIAINGK